MVAEAVEEERPRLVADAVIASDAHLKSQKEAIKADCQSELEVSCSPGPLDIGPPVPQNNKSTRKNRTQRIFFHKNGNSKYSNIT
eukprot:1415708-Amphidinium_carterae.1